MSQVDQNTADINTLEADLAARAAELSQRLDANSALITTAQQTADLGRTDATSALQQLIALETELKAYVDARIQGWSTNYNQALTNLQAVIEGNVEGSLQPGIDAALPNLQAEKASALFDIAAERDAVNAAIQAQNTAIDDLLNQTIPGLSNDLLAAQNAQGDLQSNFDLFLGSYSFDTLVQGLDNLRAENEANVQTIGISILKEPRAEWGLNVDQAHTAVIKDTLGSYGTFVTDDASFGNAFVFVDGDTNNIGQSNPIEFVPGRVYKITTRYRATDTRGWTHPYVGIALAAGTSQVFSADIEAPTLTPDDGPQSFTVYVCTDENKLESYNVDPSIRIVPTGADTATNLYAFVGQNHEGVFDGQLRVASLERKDITEVIDAIDVSKEVLRAEIENVYAELGQSYSTGASLGAAIAAMETSLIAAIPSETTIGDMIEAEIGNQYWTSAQSEGAIAAAAEKLRARVSAGAYSDVMTDEGLMVSGDPSISVSVIGGQVDPDSGLIVNGDYTRVTESPGNPRDSSGRTSGASIRIPTETNHGWGERKLWISLEVRGSTNFEIAYSTNDNGNSGWMQGYAPPEWTWIDFYFDMPVRLFNNLDPDDFIGVLVDGSGTLDVRGVRAEPVGAEIVTSQQTISKLDGYASATYAIRAKAGGAESEVEFVTASDPITGPVSAVRFNADQILLNGTVSTKKLAIADFSGNMVPDPSFSNGTFNGWDNWNDSYAAVLARNPNSSNGAISTAPAQYIARISADSETRKIQVGPDTFIPVVPGKTYAIRVQLHFGAFGTGDGGLRLNFMDENGAWTGSGGGAFTTGSGGPWRTVEGQATAPEGATRAAINLRMNGGSGTEVYFANPEVRPKQDNAGFLLTPKSITGPLIDVQTMIAEQAFIDNLTVREFNIVDGAVSRASWWQWNGRLLKGSGRDDANWKFCGQVILRLPKAARVKVEFTADQIFRDSHRSWDFRMMRADLGTAKDWTVGKVIQSRGSVGAVADFPLVTHIDTFPAGGHIFRVFWRAQDDTVELAKPSLSAEGMMK